VTLDNGEIVPAKLVGADPIFDLAVIQISKPKRGTLPTVKLGDSDKLRPGEEVIAIGNPSEWAPPVGAGRLWVGHDVWKDKVVAKPGAGLPAAHLRRAGTRSVGGINHVNVQRHIHRTVMQFFQVPFDQFDPALVKFFRGHNLDAVLAGDRERLLERGDRLVRRHRRPLTRSAPH
jgi:hypothetical protein